MYDVIYIQFLVVRSSLDRYVCLQESVLEALLRSLVELGGIERFYLEDVGSIAQSDAVLMLCIQQTPTPGFG